MMLLSRLSSNLPFRPIIKKTRSSSFSTSILPSTIPSWATLDPSSLGTATTPHAVSNLVSGQWNATTQKQLIIPNPLNRDGPPVCILPDTTVEELTPFIESLKSVPKMTLVLPATTGGAISTRSFIPHRCHATIGVFAAVSVAAACVLPEGPAAKLARLPGDGVFRIEHPTGTAEVMLTRDARGAVVAAGTLRTARKLMDGLVFPGPARQPVTP